MKSIHWLSTLSFVSFVTLASLPLEIGCSSEPAPNAPATAVQRGPHVLEIDGDPNGLYWDDTHQTLFLADDDGNRILQWTDKDGFGLVHNLPAASPQGAGLGQLVRTPDGTWVVTRFGGGSAGDVAFVSPDGKAQIVPGLSPERRRIGLTACPDGRLFDGWFVRLSSGARAGAIGELSLKGAETEVLTGLKKPIGVLCSGSDLYVSDQELGQVLKAPLSDPSKYSVLATLPSPDLLAVGPQGSIFTGSEGGKLFRIEESGAVSVFKSGFDTVRGVAYDPTNRRLFVANHLGHETKGEKQTVHILPLD